MITARSSTNASEKNVRLAKSFADDISTAATHGKWKLPKHMLLGITLRHLTGSAELITIMNRYGHCQSYPLVLELETAMAQQVTQQDSILPSNITPALNKVSHLCWDNFDINEETPSGTGTTHVTHGILIQEVLEVSNIPPTETGIVKTKERSFKFIPSQLPPCFVKKKAEPSFVNSSSDTSTRRESDITPKTSTIEESVWILCRSFHNVSYTVPDWSGWISKTAVETIQHLQSVIGFMTPIFYPITDCATVQLCLVTSLEAAKQLKQEYTLITMDLAAAKIAYDIQWQNMEKFSKVIINLGAFHAMCSFMGSLGKMMTGSGLEDILIEAGVCASGSIQKVLSGKAL